MHTGAHLGQRPVGSDLEGECWGKPLRRMLSQTPTANAGSNPDGECWGQTPRAQPEGSDPLVVGVQCLLLTAARSPLG